ncbi:hypothetical protein J31TS4_25570 [Paenibacillus sp. J31TS4]|uniref:divergent polysaccharide deacetylase family protein n=1 Tax=Paenibacillus sp. J31TS4 TaxID=2807195 RepID=UPI001B121057|nr:divergent polysaccharide deacetylase family protein [Paenibacillus sp. J31TS4]GIP39277.1 hypothetical protein J31TS4_25570 [Paenibacillus sp. J31TS4]
MDKWKRNGGRTAEAAKDRAGGRYRRAGRSLGGLLLAGSLLLGFGPAQEAGANPFVRPAVWGQVPSGEESSAGYTDPVKRVAIVIDDAGNSMKGTKEMLALPFKLTIAVMPFLSSTKEDAEAAFRAGHDVIVHLPMEPKSGKKSWLGPGAITTDMTDEQIRAAVRAALDDVPHAIGINNHMGSKATGDPRVIHAVLEVCRERGVFFLDSHTNYRSIVSKVAREVGVPSLDNHLFLDDVKSKSHMEKQFTQIREHLKVHEPCIAIGHVGAGGQKLAEVLGERVPEMTISQGVRFVGVRELFADKTAPVKGSTLEAGGRGETASGGSPMAEAAAKDAGAAGDKGKEEAEAPASPPVAATVRDGKPGGPSPATDEPGTSGVLLEGALLHTMQKEIRTKLKAHYGEEYIQYDCERISGIRKQTNGAGAAEYEVTVRLRKRSGTDPMLVKLRFRTDSAGALVFVSMTDEPLPAAFSCSSL